MKRIISIILCLGLVLAIGGCGKSTFNVSANDFIEKYSNLNENLTNVGGKIKSLEAVELDGEKVYTHMVAYENEPISYIECFTPKNNPSITRIIIYADYSSLLKADGSTEKITNISYMLTANLVASVLDEELNLDLFGEKMQSTGTEHQFDKFHCEIVEGDEDETITFFKN